MCLSLLSLLLLLLNGTVQSNDCSTEGFMELSLLEAKAGTNNNGQTTAGLAFESKRTRWIITEEDNKIRCSKDNSKLTEVLVGVDIRPVTRNRNRYPKIEIWKKSGANHYERQSLFCDSILSPQNFTTNGLYRYTLPTPLTFQKKNKDYRLGVRQPPDDRSVVRFYKVTGTGQIGRVDNNKINEMKINKNDDITQMTSSILLIPINISSNCNYPPIDSSFNTNSLSVTSVIPVNDTRAFPDIQFTCNGIITKWIIGITQNQTTSKHYPNIYLKRSSQLIHALTVDASAATSSNGNVYNFTSDIEVQYGDILVINVTTNSNPMYYQQYNGPLNYQLDSSNGLIPLEHNDYPLISVITKPIPSVTVKLSSIKDINTLVTMTILSSFPSRTDIIMTPNSILTSTEVINYSTSLHSTLSLLSTTTMESTPDQNTGSLILAGRISAAVFMLLVVTILVILIVSVLVCRRKLLGTSSNSNSERITDEHKQDERLNVLSNISDNAAYGVIGGNENDVYSNPAYGINTIMTQSINEELVYDEPKTMHNEQEVIVMPAHNKANMQQEEEDEDLYI